MARLKLDAWWNAGDELKLNVLDCDAWSRNTRDGRKTPNITFLLRNRMDTGESRSGRHGSRRVFAAYKWDPETAAGAKTDWEAVWEGGCGFAGWSRGYVYGSGGRRIVEEAFAMASIEDGMLVGVLYWLGERHLIRMEIGEKNGCRPVGTTYVEIGGAEND